MCIGVELQVSSVELHRLKAVKHEELQFNFLREVKMRVSWDAAGFRYFRSCNLDSLIKTNRLNLL